jgi:DNA topoisomerase-3
MAGRLFEATEIETLLTKGKVGPLEGFRSKMGRPFSAMVKLGDEFKQEFEFENSNGNGAVIIDPARHEILGTCPLCHQGQVYALENSYACENAVSEKKTCTFRVGKVILQREIPKEQVLKLITTGKTDLLPKFISKKGRPFSAHLKLDKGKIGFEFAEKVPRAKKTPARKAAVA